jgi:hypothetical protein
MNAMTALRKIAPNYQNANVLNTHYICIRFFVYQDLLPVKLHSISDSVCVCVRACVHVCVRACMCACVCIYISRIQSVMHVPRRHSAHRTKTISRTNSDRNRCAGLFACKYFRQVPRFCQNSL